MLSLHDVFLSYRSRRLRFASPSTVNQFEVSIGNFAEFLGARPRLSHLTNDLVSDVMAWMIANGRSPATANKFRSNVLALWRFAADQGKVKTRPDVERAPEPVQNQQVTVINNVHAGAGYSAIKRYSPTFAFFLSVLIPGLGQLYAGSFLSAVCWFCFTALGYICFIVPGLILHVLCAFSIGLSNPYR